MNLLLDSLENIKKLIEMGVGDISRLHHIEQMLKENKILYTSDADYLEKLVKNYIPKSELTEEKISDSSEDLSIEKLEEKLIPTETKPVTPNYEKNSSKLGSWARAFGRGIAGVALFLFGMAMVLFLYHVLTHLDEFGRSIYYGGDPMASIISIFVILPLIFLLIGGSSIYYGIRIISKT